MDFVLTLDKGVQRTVSLLTPNEKEVYDMIIIGAGPAGMTAAIYGARKGLKILLLSKDIGGQVIITSGIENYLGYQYITGKELSDKFYEQVSQYPIAFSLEEVIGIKISQNPFSVSTKTGKNFLARTLIIATGKRSRELNIPGERELIGRGVSYCAICDAPLFANKPVCVIGGGNSGISAVIDLLKLNSTVYLVSRSALRADKILVDRIKDDLRLKTFLGYVPVTILGKESVSGIIIKDLRGLKELELPVVGVFIEIGLLPNTEFITTELELNEAGEIIVNCNCATKVPGVFACGDVTNVTEKQIVIAAGEGAKAALAAAKWLITQGS